MSKRIFFLSRHNAAPEMLKQLKEKYDEEAIDYLVQFRGNYYSPKNVHGSPRL